MIKPSNAVILAVAITLLLNIQIFAGRGSIALGGILIGSIWIILIGLLIYAATLTKKLALQILLVLSLWLIGSLLFELSRPERLGCSQG